MPKNYMSLSGLTTFFDELKKLFATKKDVSEADDALSNRIEDLEKSTSSTALTVVQEAEGATITATDKNGTTEAFLSNGKSGVHVGVEAPEDNSNVWINPEGKESSLVGKSAYEIALDHGFDGTEAEWLESLVGMTGKSAYAYAKEGGYTGTEAEFSQLLSNIDDVSAIVDTKFENEKGNIVNGIIAELQGWPVFGVVDDDNVITIKSTISDGVYTLKYEDGNGDLTTVSTFTIGNGVPGVDEPIVIVNLADPTSTEWKTNKRINSSKNEVDVTLSGGQTMVITNLIDITGATNDTKFHIKGLDLLENPVIGGYNRVYFYDESKAYKWYWQPTGQWVSNYLNVSDYNADVQVLTNIQQLMSGISSLNGVNVKYITFGAVLTGTANDVFITKDQEILD